MGVNGIYGLSGSGLDIESMVKVGMMSKQSQLDKLEQKYTQNEWKKSAYIDLYGQVQTFNNSTLSKYKMSNTMNAHSADSSNENVVTATATASSPIMTHTVEVGQLATGAYLIGTNNLKRNGDNPDSIKLADVLTLKDSDGNTIDLSSKSSDETAAFSFTVNDGVNGMVEVGNSDVISVAGSGNVSGEYSVNISSLATTASVSHQLKTNTRHNSSFSYDDGFDILKSTPTLKEIVVNNKYNLGNDSRDKLNIATAAESIKTMLNNSNQLLSDPALTLRLGDGDSNIAVNWSWAELLDENTTFESMFDKIQNAIDENDLNLELSIENQSGGLKFTLEQKNSGAKTINWEMRTSSGAAATYLDNFKDLFSLSSGENIPGENIKGKITKDGTTTDLKFDANGIAEYDGLSITAHEVGSSTITVDSGTLKTVSVSYKELADGFTFNDLVSKINNLGVNVKATYDSVQDTFSFYNKESGSSNQIGFNFGTDTAGLNALRFFDSLGLSQSENGELSEPLSMDYKPATAYSAKEGSTSLTVKGKDAIVKIDGKDFVNASNKLTVNGVIYNFTGTNATVNSEGKVESIADAGKTTVNVSQDTEKIVENVKSFIEDYNKLLAALQDMYNEKKYSNYTPLTEAQKAEMTDEQIEKWEEKAKSGLLYHDPTLGKIIDNMRSAVSQAVGGIDSKYNNIFAIGVSTTGLKGQLTLDEDKLNKALAEDSEAVYNVFAHLSDDDTYSENGIAQRLGDVFTAGLKAIKTRSGTTESISEDSDLNNLLRELQTKMSNFRTMMNAFEEKLYKKYDAMEVALSTLGAQLNYVTSAFA